MASKRLKKKHSKQLKSCPLCGDLLPAGSSEYVIGKTGRAVCLRCLKVSRTILELPEIEHKSPRSTSVMSPQSMIEELNKSIVGQENAKQAVSVLLWKQMLRAQGVNVPKSGLLLYGPTGCGKTALVREAARIADIPFLAADATTLTEAGYRGRDAQDIIVDLVERHGLDRAKYAVIFLDEVDKLAADRQNEHRASYSRGTQHSLLKLIEGTEVRADGTMFSTENIVFVYGGAFTALREERSLNRVHRSIGFERTVSYERTLNQELVPNDFIRYGMEAELMGRIGRCVPLHPLATDDLRRILTASNLSVYRQYQRFFESYGQPLEMSESEIETLIGKALDRGMGARGLNALVEEWVEPKLLQLTKGA